MTDAPGRLRDEDAFDVTAVVQWLTAHAGSEVVDASSLGGIESVEQFGGGASNLTYLLTFSGGELVLRRPPSGTKARGAHDMAREHDLQKSLAGTKVPVPRMVALCRDESVIGSQFYVMERLRGTILRRDIPADLGLGAVDARRLSERVVQLLADIHSVDVDASGLRPLDRGPGYVARQVEGWVRRFGDARTPDVGDLDEVSTWLVAHQPDDQPHVLIHNDFRLDNLVLDPADPTRVTGVLDWELATVGDPLMDLGSTLAYWVQADDDPAFVQMRLQPSHAPGMLTRDELFGAYCERTGRSVSAQDRLFYEVFGLFRLAGIAQQIYRRFASGQTTNPRYGAFGHMVRQLDARCRHLVGAH